MAGKEFTYRGKRMQDIENLDVREFAKLVGADYRRALLRHFDVAEKFVKKCEQRSKEGKPIRTHLREMVIVPGMVGYDIGIHNGKEFVKIKIIPEMLGHRLGEFSVTRSKVQHGAPGIGATRSSAALSVK